MPVCKLSRAGKMPALQTLCIRASTEVPERGAAGYLSIDGNVVLIPGATIGQRSYTQLRAWEGAFGEGYEAAVDAGGRYGFSNLAHYRDQQRRKAGRMPALLVLGCGIWRRSTTEARAPNAALPFAHIFTVRADAFVSSIAPEQAARELIVLLTQRLVVHLLAAQVTARGLEDWS
jgi:hypothetical protein